MAESTVITVAPGIRAREITGRTFHGKPDRYLFLRFQKDGSRHEEGLGWTSQGWSIAKAKAELARLKTASTTGQGPSTLQDARKEAQRKKEEIDSRATIGSIWEAYKAAKGSKLDTADKSNYPRHLADRFANRAPQSIRTADVDALRSSLEEKGLAPATVLKVLALLRRLIRYGAKKGLSAMPTLDKLYFEMPQFDNHKTEFLQPEQIKALLGRLDTFPDQRLAATMRLALCTGIRHRAIFSLTWDDIDFINGQIRLRAENAKNGRTAFIPLSKTARQVLEGIKRQNGEERIFPYCWNGRPVIRLERYVKDILPPKFRCFHGLRHTYASLLASSGKVDMYTLQRLMTHQSPQMTERYAHLAAAALQRAADTLDNELAAAVNAAQSPSPSPEVSSEKAGRVIPFQPETAPE